MNGVSEKRAATTKRPSVLLQVPVWPDVVSNERPTADNLTNVEQEIGFHAKHCNRTGLSRSNGAEVGQAVAKSAQFSLQRTMKITSLYQRISGQQKEHTAPVVTQITNKHRHTDAALNRWPIVATFR